MVLESSGGGMSGVLFEASPSCERDGSQNFRIQEIAAEVLRLRLVHSQHRQLETQLRNAADRLRTLTADKILQLRNYLDHGLRQATGPGAMGGSNSGVDPDNLLGLMECLCVVCDARITTRKQEELLLATRWLLQDPQALVNQLVNLPAAPSYVSRRLAPFLLSCDSGWRGHLNDVGQCYEVLRSWLSCYYQFSLISTHMSSNSDLLAQHERQLEELGAVTGEGSTGGCNSLAAPPRAWRHSSGVLRSSSVQSNSSAGSRRSQSPAGDRAAGVGLRQSPRVGASNAVASGHRLSAGRGTAVPPPRAVASASNVGGGTTGSGGPESARYSTSNSNVQRVCSPVRSASPLQPSSSRNSLHSRNVGSNGGAVDKVEASPRASRFATTMPIRLSARAGAPPPNPSPRHSDPPKTSVALRRQNIPAVRARRSPSRDPALGTSPRVQGAFLPRSTPQPSSGRFDEHGHREVEDAADIGNGGYTNQSCVGSCPSRDPVLPRSRSLQSISEPCDFRAIGATPPLSTRTMRETVNSSRDSSRLRHSQGGLPSPGGQLSSNRFSQSPPYPRSITSARTSRASANPPAAGSGGTPTLGNPRRSIVERAPVGGRPLKPSESARTLRHSDAGSGGTVGGDAATSAGGNIANTSGGAGGNSGGVGCGSSCSGGASATGIVGGAAPSAVVVGVGNEHRFGNLPAHTRLATPRSLTGSRSASVLDMRHYSSGRPTARGTPDQTPRPPMPVRLR
eukprot:TRINITY_DN29205_c0_g1_i1.p1 TRINITY_DN29205_c0_g1~~TRINITY_DN29205_c0_g1_i1.p1  ORF type:complete len:793 (+),score=75.06 TRINITY_DN29205_c0_g1_i1:171-2381(+)